MRAITPILTLSALALGAGAGLSVAAAKISGPQRPVLDYALTPYEVGVEATDVRFTASDGTQLAGWWMDRPEATQVVVIAHGHRGSKSDMLGIGPGLWRDGFAVLLFDFRGNGESADGPQSLAHYEQLDLSAAVDWVSEQRPDCEVDGKVIPGADPVQFNEAFTVGGPLCTVQQVEDLTGIYIDHTVVVNFAGFEDMVDAVHGVEVCVPFEVDDPAHGIHLDAGTRLVSGREALNYVRERHVLSVNSDIGRMKRQQAFVASMVNRVMSADTLTRPDRLYRFLDAATQSIQLDPDLASLGKLKDLALELRGTDLRRIKFVTVPIETYAPDPNRLQFAAGADALWEQIREDEALGALGRGAISADEEVGTPDDEADTEAAAERRANGLCA